MQTLDEKREIGNILEDLKAVLPKSKINDSLLKKGASSAFQNIYDVLISRHQKQEEGSTRMDEIVALHFINLANDYNQKEFEITAEDLKTSYENLQNEFNEFVIGPEAKTIFQEVIDSAYTYLFAGVLIGAGIGLSLFFLLSFPVVAAVITGVVLGGLLGLSVYSSFIKKEDSNGTLEQNPHSVWNTELKKSVDEAYDELEQATFFLSR